MWDWDLVFEMALGIALGVGIGGYAAVSFAESAAYRLLAHPVLRKLADGAKDIGDKIHGIGEGGWAGVANTGLGIIGGLMGKKGG